MAAQYAANEAARMYARRIKMEAQEGGSLSLDEAPIVF